MGISIEERKSERHAKQETTEPSVTPIDPPPTLTLPPPPPPLTPPPPPPPPSSIENGDSGRPKLKLIKNSVTWMKKPL